ncbi:MAG TPA: DUF2238 domain-containing protein [Bdellovibrionales bacterium]|nr:DUF2238 domain-containing protein [Bdellovibrionales bacterium]
MKSGFNFDKFFWILAAILFVEWAALAIDVHSRTTWVLENLLVAMFVAPVAWAYGRGHLSRTSLILIFIFTMIHNIGAHYTYSLVPYERWLHIDFGERNHFDRWVHFLFGVLLFRPLRDVLRKLSGLNARWAPIVAVLTVIAFSTVYELIEFAAAMAMGDDTGGEYVGTQGDPWDAQKDQALALWGALLGWLIDNRLSSRRGG